MDDEVRRVFDEEMAKARHAMNTCEIHANVEGIEHRTACAVCFTEVSNERDQLRRELDDYERSFKLFDKALQQLTELWRVEHPNETLVLPDMSRLAQWCVKKLREGDEWKRLAQRGTPPILP